jgi:hypothetical protein
MVVLPPHLHTWFGLGMQRVASPSGSSCPQDIVSPLSIPFLVLPSLLLLLERLSCRCLPLSLSLLLLLLVLLLRLLLLLLL